MAVTDNKRPAEEEPEEQVAEKKQKTEETPKEAETVDAVAEEAAAEETEEKAAASGEEETAEDAEDDDEDVDEEDEDDDDDEDNEESESGSGEDDDVDDEDLDDEDFEDDGEENDDPPEYLIEAFNDVEGITEDDVKKFNEDYQAFEEILAKHAEQTEQEAMVLGQPQLLRPLPKSAEEFKERLPHIFICQDAINYRQVVEEEQADLEEQLEEECEERSNEVSKEQYEETVGELIKKRSSKIMEVYFRKLDVVRDYGNNAQMNIQTFMHKLLCFTDMLVSGHILSMETSVEEKDKPKELLLKTAELWRKFFAMKPEDIKAAGVKDADVNAVRTWTKTINQSLKEDLCTGECGDQYKDIEVVFEEEEKKEA